MALLLSAALRRARERFRREDLEVALSMQVDAGLPLAVPGDEASIKRKYGLKNIQTPSTRARSSTS